MIKYFSPFNSNIKIFKDRFMVADVENVIRCFLIKNGKINEILIKNPKGIILLFSFISVHGSGPGIEV